MRGSQCSFLLITIAFVIVNPSQAIAKCSEAAKSALDTCQSKALISEAVPRVNSINHDFAPKNGRMSPESCQGFSDAYNSFNKLVDSYIQNCKAKIAESRTTCQGEAETASSLPPEEFSDLLSQAKIQRSAEAEIPKLQAYKIPLSTLKTRLDDCLISLKGGRTSISNTDRGNAKTGSLPLGSTPSSEGVGFPTGTRQSALLSRSTHERQLISNRIAPDRNSVGFQSGSSIASESKLRAASARIPTSGPDRHFSAIELIKSSAPKSAGIGSSKVQLAHRRPAHFDNSLALNKITIGKDRLKQIASKHSNLFQIVRKRYFREFDHSPDLQH